MDLTIPWWEINFGEAEAEAAAEAIRNRTISQGRLTERFERELAATVGARHAVVTTSGSTALWLTMLTLGIGPGDEVIVPDVTWIATAHAARTLGATVVLVDCIADLPLMDPAELERAITPRTKAILPVHLNGRAVAMAPVLKIAARHGIAVVEDAAQAFSSRDALGPLGTLGTMGIYSLGLAKLVATGQGGVVVTNDDELCRRLRLGKVHGVPSGPQEIYAQPGLNLKFTDLQAAIGLVQLGRLTEKVQHVNRIYHMYREGLAGLPFLALVPCQVENGEVPLWTEMRSPLRTRLFTHLAEHGIQARPSHRPLHEAEHLDCAANRRPFPNASRLADEVFALPCGPAQPLANVERTIEVLHRFTP